MKQTLTSDFIKKVHKKFTFIFIHEQRNNEMKSRYEIKIQEFN